MKMTSASRSRIEVFYKIQIKKEKAQDFLVLEDLEALLVYPISHLDRIAFNKWMMGQQCIGIIIMTAIALHLWKVVLHLCHRW